MKSTGHLKGQGENFAQKKAFHLEVKVWRKNATLGMGREAAGAEVLRWGEARSLWSAEESLSQITVSNLSLKFHLTQKFYKVMGDK